MTKKGFLARIADKLKGSSDAGVTLERRRARREEITIPVNLTVGHRKIGQARARSLSPIGLFIETDAAPPKGTGVKLLFDGIGESATPIEVFGEVIWTSLPPDQGMGIQIDRKMTTDKSVKGFRAMVLHYIRHPPLLQQQADGYIDVRCSSCMWIGRTSARKPTCPRCGSRDLKSV